jgi:hypothetical protein
MDGAAEPGADVKITIFGDFFPDFGRQKIGVFLKNQCYDPNFAKASSSLGKVDIHI